VAYKNSAKEFKLIKMSYPQYPNGTTAPMEPYNYGPSQNYGPVGPQYGPTAGPGVPFSPQHGPTGPTAGPGVPFSPQYGPTGPTAGPVGPFSPQHGTGMGFNQVQPMGPQLGLIQSPNQQPMAFNAGQQPTGKKVNFKEAGFGFSNHLWSFVRLSGVNH
jgi:hypothetical protein